MKTERLLILQLKRIGDGILTAPAVAALRARHPAAEIVGVVPASFADLAGCFTGFDRVLPYHGATVNLAVWASVAVGEWDACYDFTGTDRSALLSWLSGARRRAGYAKFARGWRKHAYTELCDASVRDLHTVDFHLALVGPNAGIDGPALHTPDAVFQAYVALPERPWCVVHIGTAREEKFWPAERWAEVIEHVARTHHVILTGTNAGLERPHLDALRSKLTCEVTDFTGRLTLVELAALIEHCDLALGVDSMAMHLAATFGRPQIVLFGPTNPFHWRPRHPRALVLTAASAGLTSSFDPRAKGAAMDLISTRTVVDAIDQALLFH
jgi:ADP-heptose:LPS heptosyltransferase